MDANLIKKYISDSVFLYLIAGKPRKLFGNSLSFRFFESILCCLKG